jgi:uncharacterized membrane protein
MADSEKYMEAKLKHLEFIQATINRMASNSFLLKGWAVTVAGALLALSFKEIDHRYLLVAVFVISLFWLLDSYYLSRERVFIRLYDDVRKKSEVDFAMDATRFARRADWLRAAVSRTLLMFYGGLAAVLLLILYYL